MVQPSWLSGLPDVIEQVDLGNRGERFSILRVERFEAEEAAFRRLREFDFLQCTAARGTAPECTG